MTAHLIKPFEIVISESTRKGLDRLGLSEQFLIELSRLHHLDLADADGSTINFRAMTCDQWFWLRTLLHLPLDPFEHEEAYQTQSVGRVILNGEYQLPTTPELKQLFWHDFLPLYKKSRRQSLRFYGGPLLRKVIAENRRQSRIRRLKRCKNRA